MTRLRVFLMLIIALGLSILGGCSIPSPKGTTTLSKTIRIMNLQDEELRNPDELRLRYHSFWRVCSVATLIHGCLMYRRGM